MIWFPPETEAVMAVPLTGDDGEVESVSGMSAMVVSLMYTVVVWPAVTPSGQFALLVLKLNVMDSPSSSYESSRAHTVK